MTKNTRNTIIRIVLVSIYAILVMQLVVFAMPKNIALKPGISVKIFIVFYLLFFNLNTEGSLFFDRYLDKKLPWFDFPKKRVIIQVTILFLWAIITLGLPFTAWYFINGQAFIYDLAPVIVFISSLIFLMIFIGVSVAINFFKQWKMAILEVEYHKQEKLKSDYQVLLNQVNPHFLFNSLNVLISEIKHNPDIAEVFTRKLSKVYRYVLQSKNYELISLKKEVEFIGSFIYLHKIRIGDALEYTTSISEELLEKQIPPLTLQILIENAIKHNVANEENVLKISIVNEGDCLMVSNNMQPIANVDSTHTGLLNLKKRFELMKKEGFNYGENLGNFVVTIPLINE